MFDQFLKNEISLKIVDRCAESFDLFASIKIGIKI